MTSPTFRKIADRSYAIESDLTATIHFLHRLFHYIGAGKPGDLYAHRWRHDGPGGKTLIILFNGDPPRLAVMGPRLEQVDALAIEEVAE